MDIVIWIVVVVVGVFIYKRWFEVNKDKKENVKSTINNTAKTDYYNLKDAQNQNEPNQKLSRDELKAMAVRRDSEWRPDKEEASFHVQKKNTFNIDDTPDGYEVYENESYFVHGVTHRFKACLKWAEGNNHQISFKREPNNKYDSNAIAIFGKSSTGRRKLGYIASEIADDLVYRELDDKIKARLLSVEIKEAPFINYEILVESKAYSESE